MKIPDRWPKAGGVARALLLERLVVSPEPWVLGANKVLKRI